MEKQLQKQTATRAAGALKLYREHHLQIHNFRKAITGLITHGFQNMNHLALTSLVFLFLLGFNQKSNAQFTAGRLVVLQVGDGSIALSNASFPVFLKEYTTAGAAGISVTIPATGPTALTMSGTATSEGAISRSNNGTSIVIPGYNAPTGTAAIAGTSSATFPRAIGNVVTSTTYTLPATTTSFSANNPRGAVNDASNYWGCGSNTGVVLETSGAGVVVSSTTTNIRVLGIFNNQLYYSTGSATIGIYKVGTGLPVTAGNTSTLLIGTTGSPYGFSINANTNVCYVADDGAGIKKFTFNGSVWSLAYVLNATNCRGLVVDYSAADPNTGVGAILYATNTLTASTIFKVTDGGVAGASATTLVTAPTNTVFRGLAFAPQVLCTPPVTSGITGPNPVCANEGGVGYSVTNTVGSTYAWTIVGGTQASGTNTNSITVDWNGAGAGSVNVTETNSCGASGAPVNLPVTINPSPILSGSVPNPVCELDGTFLLNVITPAGGNYVGDGVTNNMFNPAAAGPGPHVISYTLTNAFMCSSTFSFLITVTPAANCATTMEWVLLPPGTETGDEEDGCISETDCCEGILCYGLQFTPGTTGLLLDYTTGFTTSCIGGNPPVISNVSCTMDDHSELLNACFTDDMILFNSSGNTGMLPVFQNIPVILHQVCFSVPVGESLVIVEDVITNLTASIAITPNTVLVEFPTYDDFTITRTSPVDPMDDSDNVQCVEDALPPQTPVVLNQCGEPITPMLTSIMDSPMPLDCEGTRIYTYTYNDCGEESVDWTFTYNIDHTVNPTQVGVPVPTSANVNGIGNAGPPALPVVEDVCEHVLSPMLVSITDTPDPIVCSGTRVYVYKWTDCSGLMFNWSFTYTINNVPIMNCPANTTVCASMPPYVLTGATPAGGTYSGAGVIMGVFYPAFAGIGPHVITYQYTNPQGCSNSCNFQIYVASSPVVTCRPNASVCSFEDPFEIEGCNPPGGEFSGAGVINDDMFDPEAAGLGMHTITYTVTNMNGCSSTCSFVFNVTQCPGPPVIEIIPLDPCDETTDYGTCNFEGSCCDNILCFAIRYTPGYSGMLTSYTTGFFIDCVGGSSPIVYNQSCVMNDNSFEAPMCEGGVLLFNSSGNEGSLPITVGVPVILHRLCFMVPPGTSLDIIEDIITDLTCSIDLTGGGQIDEFPTFTPVVVTRTNPVIPIMDQSSIVACLDYATPPMPPTGVLDQCCSPVPPVLYSVVDNPTMLTCEGTRVYTYRYTDCGGAYSEWHYTYFIEPVDFELPMDGIGMVACPSQAVSGTVMLPPVLSNCGVPLSPVAGPFQNFNLTDTYINCEGTISFTWIYQDCELEFHPWTFTYTIERNDFTLPPDGNLMVTCPDQTDVPPMLPVVVDNCLQVLMPSAPVISMKPFCNGPRTYQYTYTDCELNSHVWTFTYNVVYSGALTPPPIPPTMTVSCPIEAMNPGAPGPIPDACGRPVTAMFVGTTYIPDPLLCEGTVEYRYRYTACDMTTTADWVKTYNVDYTGGLNNVPLSPPVQTVSCPLDAAPPTPPAPVMDACGRSVSPVFVGTTYIPDPLLCEGTVEYRYRYTACDMTTTADWVKTYNVDYTGGLNNVPLSPPVQTVSCPLDAAPPTPPAPVMDACGRSVSPVFVGTTYIPDPLLCEGTVEYRYRYTACDMTTTKDWVKTYNVDYTGGLNNVPLSPPVQTVSCPLDAAPPTPPAPVLDACGRSVSPVFVGTTYIPDPLLCEGTVEYRYRYTACDMTTTKDWVKTYNVDYTGGLNNVPLSPPVQTVSCPLDAAPPTPPAPVMDACGRSVSPVFVGTTYIPDPLLCEGTVEYRYRYTACDMTTTKDWVKTYNVDYTGGLNNVPLSPPVQTVSCPLDAVPPTPPAPVMDACGRSVSPVFVGTTYIPDPLLCEGTVEYRYRYTACDMTTTKDWVKTYNVDYTGGLNNVPLSPPVQTVSCPLDAVPPTPPAPVMDACGRSVSPVFVGTTYIPDPLLCEGTVEYRYRYTACDMTTTKDWVKTYNVDYTGGLNNVPLSPPVQTVSCPLDAAPPTPPAPVMDACGRSVSPVFVGTTYIPDPLLCEGTVEYRYRYTACDMTTTKDWVKTYNVDYTGGLNNVPLSPPVQTVSCPLDAAPPTPPAPVMDACGRSVSPVFVGTTYIPDPLLCEGTVEYRYRYTACDMTTTKDWVKTYNVDYTGGLNNVPLSPPVQTVSCPLDAVPPTPPAPVMDACGRSVSPVFVGTTYIPDPLLCEGTVEYRYRYTACDMTTTKDWVKTYNVDYTGGLNNVPLSPPVQTVSCPLDAAPPTPPAPVMDACGRSVSPVFVGTTYIPDPLLCEGTVEYRYRYTACDMTTTKDWVKTYNVDYTGGLNNVPLSPPVQTVSCPLDAAPPTPPAPVMDACGRSVSPVFVGTTYIPDPLLCEGTVEYRYRYTACDMTTTKDWVKTYNVDYTGGLNNVPLSPPVQTVSCPLDAAPPTPPAPVMDACGRSVSPVFVGTTYIPDPLLCEGTVEYRYRYTACDMTTTKDWVKTYNVDYTGGLNNVPLSPPVQTVSCPLDAAPPTPPAPVMDACGRSVSPVFVGTTYIPDPLLCEGTVEYRYRYTACDMTTTKDWVKTYNVDYSGGLFNVPPSPPVQIVACPGLAVNPGPPANILDACGRTVVPVLIGQEPIPGPTFCNGTIIWRYRYTACDNVTTADWIKTYNVIRNDFMVPINDTVVVPFAILANPIFVPLPTVLSDCGETLPAGPPMEDYYETDTYNGCEGIISFTYFYTDCALHTHPWTFAFDVVRPDFTIPQVNASSTVPCPLLALATLVVLPIVLDADNVPLSPGPALQNYFGGDTFNGTFGTISFTWFFTDCAMHTHPYTYTYTVTCELPTEVGDPVPTSTTVDCYLEAAPPTTLPIIVDGCASVLTPTGPVIGGTNTGSCSGTITYTYTYSNCEGVPYTWVYTVNVSCASIQLKVWLEGAYNLATNMMDTTINFKHELPGQTTPMNPFFFDTPAGQPYTVAPWNYSGNLGTQYGDGGGMIPYPTDVVDWVLVIVRKNGRLPAHNVWTCAGWVHKNGDVTFPENCPPPAFTVADSFFILVQHRHHLGVLSPLEVDMPCGTAVLEWDFRTSNSYQPQFRYGQKLLEPGVWAMFTGNGEQVSSISAINSFDRTLWKVWQGFNGYSPGDYIMSGLTDSFDETAWKNNQNRTSGIVFY